MPVAVVVPATAVRVKLAPVLRPIVTTPPPSTGSESVAVIGMACPIWYVPAGAARTVSVGATVSIVTV